ncbi:MAG: DinB family protein [Tepidiformaceae bacterium]
MLAEVRVLIERARAARISLDGLLDVLPPDYWSRAAPGSRWTVAEQLAHLAAADLMLATLLRAVIAGENAVWLGETSDPAELLRRREEPIARMAGLPRTELRIEAGAARERVNTACADLDTAMLGASVEVAGALDRWGRQLRWELRGYLVYWAAHDQSHEAEIREAIATTPELSTVALTQRRRI